MILKWTKEEARVLDNELFVAQCKLAKFNLRTVDELPPSEEQVRYKDIVTDLRVKLGEIIERDAVERFVANEW